MKKKLIISIGAWIFGIGILIGWLNLVETERNLQELMDGQLEESAKIILEQALHEMREHIYESSEDILKEELLEDRNRPHVEFQIFGPKGHILLRSSQLMPLTRLSPLTEGFATTTINNHSWRVFAQTSPNKSLQVQVAHPVAFRTQLIQRFFMNTILPLILLFPVLLILISLTIGRLFRPLELFANEVKNRGPTSLSPISIAKEKIPMELQPVQDEMNGLLARLDFALEAEKRLSASAAHELRTPLTQLKLQAQIAKTAESPELQKKAIEKTLEVIDSLSRRVSQILAFTRLSHEFKGLKKTSTAIDKLLKEELAHIAPLALSKNIEFETKISSFSADTFEDLFAIAIRNLLENAINYSPFGGTITVQLNKSRDNHTVLEITNPGSPISDDHIKTLEQSSGWSHSFQGTGIGLLLIRRIAELHQIKFTIEPTPNRQGTRARLNFSLE